MQLINPVTTILLAINIGTAAAITRCNVYHGGLIPNNAVTLPEFVAQQGGVCKLLGGNSVPSLTWPKVQWDYITCDTNARAIGEYTLQAPLFWRGRVKSIRNVNCFNP